MVEQYISAISGYLPVLRLSRSMAKSEMRWSGQSMSREGYRTVSGWDEDPLTMAVESCRSLKSILPPPEQLVFASTSAYFTERLQSTIMVDALALPRTTITQDTANSRRCATTSLLQALNGRQSAIVSAAEKRKTRAGSPDYINYGDGAVACYVSNEVGARLIGQASISHDFVDRYSSQDHPSPYVYEARFIRDIGVNKIIAPTVQSACDKAGISPSEINFACVHEPTGGSYKILAKILGLTAANISSDVTTAVGDLGAVHAMFSFGVALGKAKLGDIVLVAGFGSGCDALIFKLEAEVAGSNTFTSLLEQGTELQDFVRFLNLSGAVDIDWGMRSESSLKGQATVLERYGRDMIGFIGGRDSQGNVQFPKSSIPINPSLDSPELLEDVRLADETAKIVSLTSDRLNFTPDPPFTFGLVQFENGARVMMEFTEASKNGFGLGEIVKMSLRIKNQDKSRGYRSYFWKAVPLQRNKLEAI